MKKNIKYGLLEYRTENIGDEIQSIAASRFIPEVNYYFNRDNIDATDIPSNEKVKLIMNGWYTHHPENWPPTNKSLDPLLISMHIEQDAPGLPSAEAFKTQASINYLKKHSPVGARNIPTKQFLDNIGIESYFSGCVTLTLIGDHSVKKQNYILAVDIPDDDINIMQQHTSRPILRLSTNRKRNLDRQTRFTIAKLWLYFYQSAHAVVTTRLHTILPCLAFNTPVLGISGRDPKRYAGLIDLAHHTTQQDFEQEISKFNLEQPIPNPTKYKTIRKQLEKTCSNFTGYDSKASYLKDQKIQDLLSNPLLLQFFFDATNDTVLYEDLKNSIAYPAPPSIKNSTKALAKAIKQRLKKP